MQWIRYFPASVALRAVLIARKIVNLVADPSSSSRLSKQSFYVALALLAFAQTHHELSIEAVSASDRKSVV